MLITQTITVRNSAQGGTRLTGLAPAWVQFASLATGAALTPPAAPVEVGRGVYRVSYDAEVSGEAAGQIDVTPTGTTPGGATLVEADRYVDVLFTRDSSRLQTALPVPAPGQTGGLPTVNAANQVQTDPSFVVDSAGGTTVTFAKWLQIVLSLLTQKYIVQLNYPMAGQQTATYYRLDGVTSTISTTVTFDAQGHPLSRGVPTIT